MKLPTLVLVALFCFSPPSETIRLFVHPQGQDQWSGTRPLPGEGDGPFRTVQRATAEVVRLRKEGFRGTIVVELAPGRYELSKPWIVPPAASGTPDGPTIFRAAKPLTAILSGGKPITEWRQKAPNLWEGKLPDGVTWITDLYVDGQRRRRARSPNSGYFRILGSLNPWTNRQKARRDPSAKIGIVVRPEDLADLDQPHDAQIILYHSWTASRHHIAELDRERGRIRFTAPSNWPVGYWDRRARWYIEHTRAALDEPGEWFCSRETGTVLYVPLPNERLEDFHAIAPVLDELLVLDGNPTQEQFVQHVRFENLVFEHTRWTLGRNERCDGQAAAFLNTAAIHARGARNCQWNGCVVRHVGTYALWLDEGCQGNTVSGCAFSDMGAGGVRIGQTQLPKEPSRRAERNAVEDCLIRSGGRVYPAGVGVWIGRSSYNTVRNNHICDLYYTGISVGWSWGYAPSSAHHNLIHYNYIHRIGQGELSDMGGIYTLGISPGTEIRGNVIHDVESYSYGGWGIYPDEGSSEILITENIVYFTKTGGFHQHYGRENRVYNNIFAYSRLQQLQRTRREPHISFYFERNIVLYRQGQLMAGAWDDGRFVLDYNVYWNESGPVVFPGGRDLKAWQALGHDRHSIVADPRLADPRGRHFDLLQDSPALRLGFRAIDASRAGPRRPLPVPLHGSP